MTGFKYLPDAGKEAVFNQLVDVLTLVRQYLVFVHKKSTVHFSFEERREVAMLINQIDGVSIKVVKALSAALQKNSEDELNANLPKADTCNIRVTGPKD